MSKQYNKLIKRRRLCSLLGSPQKALAESTPKKATAKAKPARKKFPSPFPKKQLPRLIQALLLRKLNLQIRQPPKMFLGPDCWCPSRQKLQRKQHQLLRSKIPHLFVLREVWKFPVFLTCVFLCLYSQSVFGGIELGT